MVIRLWRALGSALALPRVYDFDDIVSGLRDEDLALPRGRGRRSGRVELMLGVV